MTFTARLFLLTIGVGVSQPVAAFDEFADCPAGITKMRFDDDWSCFRERHDQLEGLEQVKAIPLGEGNWLSVGGEVRQRYEYTHNPGFGARVQDRGGVWLQRYTLLGDLRLGDHVRGFVQLLSGLENHRAGGATTVDENKLVVQNAFVELSAPTSLGNLSARMGRQELDFGSGRLIDVREGTNVRRTFDAVRLGLRNDEWRVDGFAARLRDPRLGFFDDRTSDTTSVWGVYATGSPALLPAGNIDLYYIGYRNKAALFTQGPGDEKRHSLGARVFGKSSGLDWNWEALYQFGSFGRGDIRAWTIATDTGYTFERSPLRPRIALSANIASGDDDPGDGDLETFNPLFPRGNYFSEAAVLGPRNFWNLHGFVTINPTRKLALTADVNAHWRLRKSDGVYSPAGQIIAPAGGSKRFVGHALSLSADYAASQRLFLGAIYTHFSTGPVIDALASSNNIDFIELTAQYRF